MANNITGGVDITKWATSPNHEKLVNQVYTKIKGTIGNLQGDYLTQSAIDNYIQNNSKVKEFGGSEVTSGMIMKTAKQYDIEPALIMAIAQVDSHFGVTGKGAKTKNPGNWGNDDAGNIVTFETWDEGIDAIGKQLKRYRDRMSPSQTAPVITPPSYIDGTIKKVVSTPKEVYESVLGDNSPDTELFIGRPEEFTANAPITAADFFTPQPQKPSVNSKIRDKVKQILSEHSNFVRYSPIK